MAAKFPGLESYRNGLGNFEEEAEKAPVEGRLGSASSNPGTVEQYRRCSDQQLSQRFRAPMRVGNKTWREKLLTILKQWKAGREGGRYCRYFELQEMD